MISGATEEELELATARADILLVGLKNQLKVIDKYYEKEIDRLNKEISRIMEIIDLNLYNYGFQIKEEITSGDDEA